MCNDVEDNVSGMVMVENHGFIGMYLYKIKIEVGAPWRSFYFAR
jgi:hypothetical protein